MEIRNEMLKLALKKNKGLQHSMQKHQIYASATSDFLPVIPESYTIK
jgi:hypothetical protein